MIPKNLVQLLPLAIFGLLSSACSSAAIPGWPETDLSTSQARAVVERSVEAHGGNVFEDFEDLSVSYEGRWGRLVALMQPLMADKRYRSSSQERYILDGEILLQLHEGPGGTKTVFRDRDSVAVLYNDEPVENDEDTLAASAVVVDSYLMMITAPSWFLRPGVELSLLPSVVEDGATYRRVQARFRPGYGFGEKDRALLWIDEKTSLLYRVQFSIDGFRKTQGAEVGVTFFDHREIDGKLWPTRFVERVHEPVSAFAHRWRLTGLDLDRGLTADDLDPEKPSPKAMAPAGSP